ncbi:MAG: hypothetical protein J0H01_34195 [Rhizobiales bacterium]|nr:hypothetical protein [Hyphomicrobiales bacterium]
MQQFTFDVMNGPAVQFSEKQAFPDVAAARIYAAELARSAHAMWRDVEDWRVELCDADDRIIHTVPVTDCRLPERPARAAPVGRRAASGPDRAAEMQTRGA